MIMNSLLTGGCVLRSVMAAEHTAVGLSHPTVVPENLPSEHDETAARCPACGRPLGGH